MSYSMLHLASRSSLLHYTTLFRSSDPERVLATILERDGKKWMRPARGQFQLYYRSGAEHAEYQPDFVVETDTEVLIDRKSTRLNSSHLGISYSVLCLKKKNNTNHT